MHLKSIELTGFKSFAKKSELLFTSSISAIVGPNGSGKSNVAEAFRFVLGEQSMKSLRSKRGEDLIFNGTPEVPRANRAGVKVVFDNSRKTFNIDFPEVILERVVHRDGVNEYFINGSAVRLKDIIELLSQVHIGASGHHIISQGEADRILNANSKERKSMIEDALGLKIYQYKKQESERKLSKTEENIAQVESLRREIAPHIKFLSKQVEKAEKVREMKEKLVDLYKSYLHREEIYVEITKKNLEIQREPLKERLEVLDKELKEAEHILSKGKNRDEKSGKIVELQTKMRETRAKRDDMTRELGRIEGEINSLRRMIEKQKERETKEENKTVLVKDVRVVSDSIKSKIAEIFDLSGMSDFGKIREALSWIRNTLEGFVSEKERGGNRETIVDAEVEIVRLDNERARLDKEIHDIKNVEQGFSLEYDLLRMEIEKEKDTSRDAEKRVFQIQAEQNEFLGNLRTIQSEIDRVNLVETDFKREREIGAMLLGRDILTYREIKIDKSNDMNDRELSREEIAGETRNVQEDRRKEIEKYKIRLEDAGAGGFEDVLKEYKEVTERDEFLARELNDLKISASDLQILIVDLEVKIGEEFQNGVYKINKQFTEFFTLMFGGGSASLKIVKEKKRKKAALELEEEFDDSLGEQEAEEGEEEEGIEVEVNLPRKKIKGLMMLSGGERALTSIALLFAVSQVNPPPFIILDETDAALDEANSKKYGDMVENLSKHSQLIVITHNRETMSRAGILYGITMNRSGVSTLLSIKFDEAIAVAK